MNKILLLEKDISYINILVNNTTKSLDRVNESYLHKNLNHTGWTLRHFICLLISLNKMILSLEKFNIKELDNDSFEKNTRKYIGEEMFQLFSLRKDKLVEKLQTCEEIKGFHIKQIQILQEKIENLDHEKNIDLYKLINKKTKKINELSKNLDQINGYVN